MKVPLSWLNEYVQVNDVDVNELAKKITQTSAEVSSIEKTGGSIPFLLVGRIISIKKHPNADKLNVCGVDLGEGDIKTIVCGANNVVVDALVPVALEGAILPNGLNIKKAKIRSIDSDGMICSKAELGLEKSSDGIWIIGEDNINIGDNIGSILGDEDYILDIDVMANRGDILGIRGFAREIAAILNRKCTFKEPDKFLGAFGNINIKIENTKGCPRYVGRLIKNIKVGPSPKWIVDRLAMAGIRSVNNIVDATNYVLLEFGIPIHAFDLDKLEEESIVVRNAKEGEVIKILDGTDVELTPDILTICDKSKPIAIAGIMGGANSEISSETNNILIEAAYFDPVSIRVSSKKLGIKSDASYRFERGVDYDAILSASNRCVEIIMSLMNDSAKVDSIAKDVYEKSMDKKSFVFDTSLVKKQLGIELSQMEIADYIKKLGFTNLPVREGVLKIEVPNYRNDINYTVDIVEEIARLYGYNDIPAVMTTLR